MINRRIHLAAGTDERRPQRELCRVGRVPNLETVEAPLHDEVLAERQIGIDQTEIVEIGGVEESRRARRERDVLEIPDRLARIQPSGAQTDPRIRCLGDRSGQRDHRQTGNQCSDQRLHVSSGLVWVERASTATRSTVESGQVTANCPISGATKLARGCSIEWARLRVGGRGIHGVY